MSTVDDHHNATKKLRIIGYEIESIADGLYASYQTELGRVLMSLATSLEEATEDASKAFGQEITDGFRRANASSDAMIGALLAISTAGDEQAK